MRNPDLQYLDEADTIDDLGSRVLLLFMAKAGIRDNLHGALKMRFRWAGGSAQSLERVGQEANLTRERIRQLQQKIAIQALDLLVLPRICYSVLNVATHAQDESAFWLECADKGLQNEAQSWTVAAVLDLIEVLGGKEQITEDMRYRLEPGGRSDELRRIGKAARKHRNKLGIMRLSAVERDLSVSRELVIDALNSLYQVVYVSGDLSLSIQRPPGMFLSSIIKQLRVAEPLEPQDLISGIERIANSRGAALTGTEGEMCAVIELVCGSPSYLSNLPADWVQATPLTEPEQWMADQFAGKATGLVHRDEIIANAVGFGIKVGSVNAYLSALPFVRSAGSGVYRLVGSESSKEEVKLIRTAALALNEFRKPALEFVDPQTISVTIPLTPSLLSGGSVGLPPEELSFFKGSDFELQCECGELASRGRVTASNTGFLVGFAPLLNHVSRVHAAALGALVVMLFSFDSMKVRPDFSRSPE